MQQFQLNKSRIYINCISGIYFEYKAFLVLFFEQCQSYVETGSYFGAESKLK